MILNLPRYNQRDSNWFDELMEPSTQVLGMQGCLVTSAAMLASAFGKQVDPKTLCKKLSLNGGFNGDGTINYFPLAAALGLDFGYRWDTTANVAPNHMQVSEVAALRHIEWLASVGIPTLIWVDTDHDGKANHWVCYVGDGMVNDPWDGTTKPLETVFQRLYGYAIYNGDSVMGVKITALLAKANDIAHGRNVALNASEINQVVNRP